MLAAILAACDAQPANEAVPVEEQAEGLQQVPLTIRSGDKVHRFTVEVARTAEEQQKGLMFRKSLAPDRGMIFPFAEPAPQTLWMKDMLIPLDMLFIRADGIIAGMSENAKPQSLDPVVSTDAVAAVLEIPGGRAAELGIGVGDKVEWPR